MKSAEVVAALRARHSREQGWVCLEEPFNIDFLALACHGHYASEARRWADATHPWVAYEIKVSRSDFRNEVKRPEKRAFAVAITHEFYFATPEGLVNRSELPEGCGLLEVHPGGTHVRVRAPITRATALSHYHQALLLRHGIDPGWLRAMAQKRASARWRERQAMETKEVAEREVARARGILAELLGPSVVPGSNWRPRRAHRGPEWVSVLAVSDRVVKLTMPGLSWEPTLPLGEFLMEYESAGTMEECPSTVGTPAPIRPSERTTGSATPPSESGPSSTGSTSTKT